MPEERGYAALVAVFAAGLYLALLVAAFGMISLVTNTEVIADPAVGTLVGPAMTGAAVLTLLAFLLVRGTRVPAERQRVAPVAALGIGVACYAAYAAVGGVAGALGDPAQPLHSLLFAFTQLASVYAIVVGVAAFVVTLLYQLVLVGRFRQRGRPRWPWERDEDE